MRKVLTTFLLSIFCFFGYAQIIDPVLIREMEQRNGDEKIKVIVIMKSQYDRTQLQRRANYYATRAERRDFVVNELKQFAESSQYDLRKSLDEMERHGMTTAPRIIWVANALYFSATKQAINDLAMRKDIEIIGLDEEKQMPVDEVPTPVSNSRSISGSVVQVNADQVWKTGNTGKAVVVAILDTGVNYNHADLADHLWDGGPEFPHHGWDFCDNDDDPTDEAGHGTHCAGIACGDGTSGCRTGVAPDALVMCVKIQRASHQTVASLTCEGMQWAVEQGADVLNMSLGIFDPSLTERTLFRYTCAAVLDAGVVSAVGVGNTGNSSLYPVPINVGVPAACPPPYLDPDQEQNPGGLSCVVSVGAVDADDNPTIFTSNGPVTWADTEFGDYPYTPGSTTEFGLIRPEVCAPGESVISTAANSFDGYVRSDGTSCSAPFVAGCMALMLSKNRNATPAEICRILEETAVSPIEGKSNIFGYGRIDAFAAVNMLGSNNGNIVFADANVKEICVSHWDTDGDGELSYWEASRVDSLEHYFQETGITSFNELQYFTRIRHIRLREFYRCTDLTSIIIPSSVGSIEKDAFGGCRNLAAITVYSSNVPKLSASAFNNTNGSFAIYVPYETLTTYKSATNWSDNASRIYPWLNRSVAGYGSSISNKWAFVASPVEADIAPATVENMILPNNEYDLYRFNQAAQILQWENYKTHTEGFVLENGQGYLYASREHVDLVFKGPFNEKTIQEVSLACSGDDGVKGWNLVGNPFPYDATVTGRSYYTMSLSGTGIFPNPVSSERTVHPCTGIFVKAESTETNPTVTFSKPGSKNQLKSQGLLEIAVVSANPENHDVEDMAIISFNEGDQLGKLYFGNDNASLCIPQGDMEYAIVSLVKDEAQQFSSTPVNFKTKKDGKYTITIHPANVEMDYLHLVDHITGADIDMLQQPSYDFTAKTTDYESRFRLVFCAEDEVGSSIGSETAEPFAYISNGEIIFTVNEHNATVQIVDVLGHVVFQGEATSRVSTEGLASGLYMLRLVEGNTEKMQRIVVP